MTREILFRAKRIDNKEQVEGNLIKNLDNCCFIVIPAIDSTLEYCLDCDRPYDDEDQFRVISKTVCQYTGLTDKNGRKIFEGDIVKRTDLHTTNEPSVGFIEYNVENTSFLIHWTDIVKYSATFPWKDKIGVIGNIFDNPEIVKEITEGSD